MCRCEVLKIPTQFTVLRLLDDLVELRILGYPPSVLKALTYSIPPTPPAQALRRVVRAWLSSIPRSAMVYRKDGARRA